MTRFRVLTCLYCLKASRVMVVTNPDQPEQREQFSLCKACGNCYWMNLPEIGLHPDDAERMQELLHAEEIEKRNRQLKRDPDSPEAQPWWYDE